MFTTLEKSHSLGNRVEVEKFWFEKINTFLKARYIDRVSFFLSVRETCTRSATQPSLFRESKP